MGVPFLQKRDTHSSILCPNQFYDSGLITAGAESNHQKRKTTDGVPDLELFTHQKLICRANDNQLSRQGALGPVIEKRQTFYRLKRNLTGDRFALSDNAVINNKVRRTWPMHCRLASPFCFGLKTSQRSRSTLE